ncbi:MAG: TonB-dependent receptor [Ignavibacteria bacterium]|nr:TonB-dependent receptor [Ignavibacteria bacterium]
MKISKYIFLFSVLLLGAGYAEGQDTASYSSEEIRVFGTRGIISTARLPAFVQVIDRKSIEVMNGDRLSEILRTFAGVSVRSYGGRESISTISMNGAGADNTLILLDGIRLNSPQNNQFDASQILKDGIERIEVLNGGMSSLYGSEAIGGVVNIITSKPKPDGQSAEISAGAGSYGLRTAGITGNFTLGSINLKLGWGTERSENDFTYLYTGGNSVIEKQRKNSSYKLDNFSAGGSYGFSPASVLTFNSGFISSVRGVPGIETGSEASASSQTDKNWLSSLRYSYNANRNVTLSGTVSYSNDLSKYYDGLSKESYYKNSGLTGTGEVLYGAGILMNTTGASVGIYDLASNELTGDAKRYQPAVYTANEIEITSSLRIFPSIRYDHYSDLNTGALTGNFGVNFKPDGGQFFFKGRIGNNYSAPTFNQLYWSNGGNTGLRPEKSVNVSLGAGFDAKAFAGLGVELSYSHINTTDKIVWLPGANGFWSPANIRSTEANELTLTANARGDISRLFSVSANVSATYNSAQKSEPDFTGDFTSGNYLPYVPQWSSKAGIQTSYRGISCNLFYEYIGQRFATLANNISLPAAGLLDAGIQYRQELGGVSITGRMDVNNLLNEDYQMIAGYPMPMRNFEFKIKLEYR